MGHTGRYLYFVMLLWPVLFAAGQAQIKPLSMQAEGSRLDVDVHGNIMVLDAHHCTLAWYDQTMKRQGMAGGPGWENGRFDQPAGLWAKNGLDVYVADYGNHRIQRFDRTLSFVSALSTRDADDESIRFGYPTDVTLSRLGTLFICDSENNRIVKVDVANRVETTFGGFGGGAGRLQHPVQVEIGPNDWVYVLDPPRVVVFDSFGNFLTTVGGGILMDPILLAGDEKGVVVVDGVELVCFTESHRVLPRIPITGLVGQEVQSVQSLSLAGERLYLLSPGHVYVVPDPRPGLAVNALEKEGKSP